MVKKTENKQLKQVIEDVGCLLNGIGEGFVLFDSNSLKIIYKNPAAEEMLGYAIGDDLIGMFSDEDEIEKLLSGALVKKYLNMQMLMLVAQSANDGNMWLRIISENTLALFEQDYETTAEINRSMRKLLMEHDQGSLMISDAHGNILFTGQETVDNCGHDKNWYIGKNVWDLESQKIFYPSAIKKAILEKSSQVVIQNTRASKKVLVAMGVPVFDEDGEIKYVMSVTKDFTDQLNLSNAIAEMNFNMNITNDSDMSRDEIISCNEKMLEIKSLIRTIAPTRSTVLILGETGTGKDLVARAIHNNSSVSDGPFIKVSCGSLSPTIVESELYGYEEGAFTGATKGGKVGLLEAANGGTVFLDEIGELPLEQQVKLLHVIQEKYIVRVGGTEKIPLNVRIVAATNRNLKEMAEAGTFREDLYYRLNVVSITIPPLRKRRCDIAVLSEYLVRKYNQENGTNKRLAKGTINILKEYDWPGNVRELENVVENMIVTTPLNYIDKDALPENVRFADEEKEHKRGVEVNEIVSLKQAIEMAERQLIEMAREEYRTTTAMSEVLGVNQSTISRKMKEYNIK